MSEELEAWRLIDPEQRRVIVDVAPASKAVWDYQVRVMLSEGKTGRMVTGYDIAELGDPTAMRNRVRAGHRCGVARVVEAALARWSELYEGAS